MNRSLAALHAPKLGLVTITLAVAIAPIAGGQRAAPAVDRNVPVPRVAPPVDRATPVGAAPRSNSGARPVILLTGYWPPTNEAVRRFSQQPAKNPGGWVGSDWRGLGFDIVSYFPEFQNPNCSSCGQGMGDLEVDYQDTTADFARITEAHRPIAIITFSRGFNGISWEVESNQYNRAVWFGDFTPPRQPTPSPPDGTLDPEALRYSALPTDDIVSAVDAAGVGVQAAVCESANGGGYLSEFIAYLGVWYQALHNDPLLPDWCVAAGHIHVGADVTWPNAAAAVDVTLETLIAYVDGVLACPPILPYCEGAPNSAGRGAQLSALRNPSIAGGGLELVAQRVPAGTSAIAFYGPQRALGTIGNGQLCVARPLRRLPGQATANAAGWLRVPLDYQSAPLGAGTGTVTAGSTWSLQVWYRDTGVAAGSNTTNALEVTFCP